MKINFFNAVDVKFEKLHAKRVFTLVNKPENKIPKISGNGFKTKTIKNVELKFISNFSIGTNRSITVYGMLDEDKSKIILRTKLSFDLYVVSLIAAIFFIMSLITKEDVPSWLPIVLLIVPFWFFGVYRIQEIWLINRIESSMRKNHLII